MMNLPKRSRSPHTKTHDGIDVAAIDILDRAPPYQTEHCLKDDQQNVALSDFFSALKISCGSPFLDKIAIVQDNARTQKDTMNDIKIIKALPCTKLEVRESQRWDTNIREYGNHSTMSPKGKTPFASPLISYPRRRLSLERQEDLIEIHPLPKQTSPVRHSCPSRVRVLPSYEEAVRKIRYKFEDDPSNTDAGRDALNLTTS